MGEKLLTRKWLLLSALVVAVAGIGLSQTFSPGYVELYMNSTVVGQGESLSYSGRVVHQLLPQADRLVGLQVQSQGSVIQVDQVRTDKHGRFSGAIGTEGLVAGNYTVSASIAGGDQHTQHFRIIQSPIDLSFTVDKEQYAPNATVTVNGSVTRGNQAVDTQVAVQVNDPQQALVFIDQIVTDAQGRFTTAFSLPADAPAGHYRVFVSAEGISQLEMLRVTSS